MAREFSHIDAPAQRRRLLRSFAFTLCCISFFASLTLTSILSAQNANKSATPQPAGSASTPAPTLTPTPSPTPTPPSTLHQWGAVTLFHGLPSDRVRAIAQGEDGAMWFGTDAGLAKYDGRRTQALAIEGLMSKRILALRLDMDGALWIGTETGAGLLLANGEYLAISETAGKVITAIITPEKGRAILASEEGVIFDCRKLADDSLDIKTIPEKPLASADFERPGPLNLTSLAMKDGVLYIGTRSRGVITIEGDTVSEIRSTPRPFFVETIEADSTGRLWYGAKAKAEESGLYEAHDAMRPVRTGAGLGMVTTLRAGVRDDMWAGTDGRGVFHYDNSSHLRERFTFEGTAGGLRSDHVYAVFVDREEVVWFGTDRGVSRYDPHAPRVENVSNERESNFVRTLFQASAGPLFAGTNRGLFIYDEATSSWSLVQDLTQSPVYAIVEDRKGRIVVGAGSGLYRSEKSVRESASDLRLTRIEATSGAGTEIGGGGGGVRALAVFQGDVYVGIFGRGVERLDASGRTLIWPGPQANAQEREVVHLSADKSGRLWIGTALSGAFVYDGRETKALPALEKLRGSAVWSIDDGGDDHLWFASARGLYLYRGGRLSEVAQGFDARSVVATSDPLSPQASAWCATSGGGLLRVLMNDQLGAVVSRMDAEQGLPSQSAFAVLPVRDGEGETILIGTNRGVARYSPGNVAPVLSPVRISGQRIHELGELKTGLHLDYPQNSLLLDVAATSSRTYPEQFQYAFLLTDTAGRVIKQKFSHDAQFTMESLKPGQYHVLVRAFSKDLVASEPLSFEFAVAGAPFPRTIVALSVLLALALLALWWGYHQNRRLARTGETLIDTNRQLADARMQLANETEAERRRIARDLHDQTLADLRHLLMLTDQLPPNGHDSHSSATPATPAVFRSEIEAISTEIRRICEDLSPSVLENVGFSAALEWALSNTVAHSPTERKFEYEFLADEGLDERVNFSRATELQIYRIVQEAVSNLARHSSATHVRLMVTTSAAGEFTLTLEDDGRDFDPQNRRIKQGRGLANIRARASLIEAEVNWKRRRGGGTKFTLRKEDAVRIAATQNAD